MPQLNFFPQPIKNIFHLYKAFLACCFYKFPARKLVVIGVTGTDGKTTTCYFIHSILTKAGKKAGLVTTIEAKIGEKLYETGLHTTTPNPWALQKFLAQMVSANCKYAVLEVTSHGLDQHRVWGIPFEIGIVTNVTHEHLDYHRTYEKYLHIKAKLIKKAKTAILNKDDKSYSFLCNAVRGKRISFSLDKQADLNLESLQNIQIKLLGDYNRQNALAAIAITKALGISDEFIKDGIEAVKFIPGRMQVIQKEPFFVIVDFAHTPNALEQVLKYSAKCKAQGEKLIVIFGCAGLRDKEKRPKLGNIAAKLADFVVLTAEDPRTERLDGIIEQIAKGCKEAGAIEGKTFFKIPDRQAAINFAIQKLAKQNDIVLITGKGHEKSMCFGKKEFSWSDQEAVEKALSTRHRPSTALGATAG